MSIRNLTTVPFMKKISIYPRKVETAQEPRPHKELAQFFCLNQILWYKKKNWAKNYFSFKKFVCIMLPERKEGLDPTIWTRCPPPPPLSLRASSVCMDGGCTSCLVMGHSQKLYHRVRKRESFQRILYLTDHTQPPHFHQTVLLMYLWESVIKIN